MGARRWLIVAAGLLVLLLPVACGRPLPAGVGPPPSTDPASSPPVTTAGPATTSVPPTKVPSDRPPALGELTLRGTAAAGVEKGCVILSATDGQVYLLLGGDRQVIGAGGQLEVSGRAVPGLLTTCQQGIPFEVATARRI